MINEDDRSIFNILKNPESLERPSFRKPSKPSVMDVLAKKKSPVALPINTNIRPSSKIKNYLGGLIDKGNAINKSWNQKLLGQDTIGEFINKGLDFDKLNNYLSSRGPVDAITDSPQWKNIVTPFIEQQVNPALDNINQDFQAGVASQNAYNEKQQQNRRSVPLNNPIAPVQQTARQEIPADINDMTSYNKFANKGQDQNKVYLPDGHGWITKFGAHNVGGLSNGEVLDRLIARRNREQDALIEERNRNPFISRQRTEADNFGGVDAENAVNALRTKSIHTGRKDIFGNEIMETPRSVRINTPLDFNYSKDSRRARKYDEDIASGMSREDAYADVINEGRSYKDRKMRLEERKAVNSNAIDKEKLGIDKFIAESNDKFKGEQAKVYPAQAAYYKAYAEQLKNKNSSSIKEGLTKAFFSALTEISKQPDGPEKEMALERLYAARSGKRLKVIKPATEGTEARWFTGYKPPKPAEFVLDNL